MRPSPRTVAAETPGTEPKLLSRLLITTWRWSWMLSTRSALRLPFADASVDAVVAVGLLQQLGDAGIDRLDIDADNVRHTHSI